MSVNSANTTTSSTDLNNTVERQPFIDSDLIVNSDQLTEKQHRVLLSTSMYAGRTDVSFSAIARNARVSTTYVRMVLIKFIDRQDLPAACKVFDRCTPTKGYDDLTETQRTIVNETVVNPDSSRSEIAEVADCTYNHVRATQVIYDDIIQERRKKVCA
jgi:hypothetical protein